MNVTENDVINLYRKRMQIEANAVIIKRAKIDNTEIRLGENAQDEYTLRFKKNLKKAFFQLARARGSMNSMSKASCPWGGWLGKAIVK
jgi:hypothetical protein